MKLHSLPFLKVAPAFLVAAIAFPATAQTISIQIHQPAANALVADSVSVRATVQSTYAVSEVKAAVGAREISLVYDPAAVPGGAPGWKGTLSLVGLARGPYVLAVTAQTVDGGSASAQRTFRLDRPPQLTVLAPMAESVARPSLRFTATCTDDDPTGCSVVRVYAGEPNPIVATGTSSIDQDISFAAWEGQTLSPMIMAIDSVGQQSSVRTTIHVESSPILVEVTSTPGTIFDFSSDRILYRDSLSGTLVIRSRTTGNDTPVPNPAGKVPQYGFLSPHGAIFAAREVVRTSVYEWRDGQLLSFPPSSITNALTVAGNFALWGGSVLYRRDLDLGTTVEISPTGDNGNHVAANGVVAYWSPQSSWPSYQVYLYNNGNTTQVTATTNYWHVYPVTDGTGVAYRKNQPFSMGTFWIARNDNGAETILDSSNLRVPLPLRDYQVVNGSVAFTRFINGVVQVLVSSPSLTERPASIFGSDSFVDVLFPNGEVTFTNSGRRYLSMAGRQPIHLSSTLGRLTEVNGARYVTIGRVLFRVALPDRGDANGDGRITTSDIFYMINNLFGSGSPPVVNSDFNGDGAVTVTDVFYAINYLFAGGPGPVGGN